MLLSLWPRDAGPAPHPTCGPQEPGGVPRRQSAARVCTSALCPRIPALRAACSEALPAAPQARSHGHRPGRLHPWQGQSPPCTQEALPAPDTHPQLLPGGRTGGGGVAEGKCPSSVPPARKLTVAPAPGAPRPPHSPRRSWEPHWAGAEPAGPAPGTVSRQTAAGRGRAVTGDEEAERRGRAGPSRDAGFELPGSHGLKGPPCVAPPWYQGRVSP